MISLKQAVSDYLAAVDAFRQFEKDFPNDSTKRWAMEFAENDLRAAYAVDPLPPVEPVAEVKPGKVKR